VKLLEIEVKKIRDPKHDVRAKIDMESIAELAESIRTLGLLQPIMVRAEGKHFEVVAGHRRLMAVRQLGLERVECLVVDETTDDLTMARRLHENIYRVDLTPLEEAAVYAELFEKVLDTDKVAAIAHRSRETVERRLRLLELDDRVRDALHEGQIGVGVAELLHTLTHDDTRHFLLDAAIRDGASVEKVRLWVKDYRDTKMLTPEQAAAAGVSSQVNNEGSNPMACWLCGSPEEPHDMRVKMVHATCERMARRAAEDNLARSEADGNPS
jgi:ParB family transcriptional regulator, chromosome partitioning protein